MSKYSIDYLRSQGMDVTRPLTGAERVRIIREAREVQAAEAVSNAAVARILGCSPATWSQIRSAKYKGDNEEYLRRARQWLDERHLSSDAAEVEFVRTTAARHIMAVCTRAWQAPTIGLVVTRSGVGKTAALLEYKRTRGRRCIYLQAGEALSSKTGLLMELAVKLDISTQTRSGPLMYHQVRARLAGMYAAGAADSPLLLVDEATTLTPSAINMLRNLHDDPACRLGLVLADTWRIDGELRRRGRNVLAGGYEQLTSRAGAQYRLRADAEIPLVDVTAVAGSILASLGAPRKLPARSPRYLQRIAQLAGALRNVQHRLHAAHDVAEAAGAKPTYCVTELDFVAPLVGGTCELEHTASPFGSPRRPTVPGPRERPTNRRAG